MMTLFSREKPFKFDLLPVELQDYIFQLMDNPQDVATLSLVCTQWMALSGQERIWRKFGCASKEEWIYQLRCIKAAKAVCSKRNSDHFFSIYLFGVANNKDYWSDVIPGGCSSFSKGGVTRLLYEIKINGHHLLNWYRPETNDIGFFEDILERNNKDRLIALACITHESEVLKYQQLVNGVNINVPLVFATKDEKISMRNKGIILLKDLKDIDKLKSVYGLVMARIEELANAMPVSQKKEESKIFSCCRVA